MKKPCFMFVMVQNAVHLWSGMNILFNFFLLLITFPFLLKSQLIVVQPEKIFESPWVFNPEYILKNKIKKIHLQILDKKDFHAPENLNRQMVFEYDKYGREIYSFTVEPIGTETRTFSVQKGKKNSPLIIEKKIPLYDTNFKQICYADNGTIKFIRQFKKNHPAITSYFIHYPNGFIKEIKCREWPQYASEKVFILQKQEIIFIDSFQTLTPSEKFRKNIYFNTDLKPYKEQQYEYDENGLKIIRDVFITAPWIEQYKKFEYENNRIKKAIMYANAGVPLEYEYEYQYDDKLNLYSIYFRKNKFLEKETGFVYEARTNEINGIVIRDYTSKSIQIIRLHIESFKSPLMTEH